MKAVMISITVMIMLNLEYEYVCDSVVKFTIIIAIINNIKSNMCMYSLFCDSSNDNWLRCLIN